jgi:hypothetical protein
MKVYVTTPPVISVAAWLRRYATELIVIAMVALATLGTGVAQVLYSNAKASTTASDFSLTVNAALDQHERHVAAR